ncbi:hypothetical protein SDC9_160402 [bioreactor metagenome]|uniref:Uncharacterized protein n=1 Tax=bioreactor metagenome TaxID=1076179 RepID=A0A645FHT4_9ZZZZ
MKICESEVRNVISSDNETAAYSHSHYEEDGSEKRVYLSYKLVYWKKSSHEVIDDYDNEPKVSI